MSKFRFFAVAVISGCLVMAIGACSKSSDTGELSALRAKDGLLKYVPADTPYLFATPERMPQDVRDKLAPHVDAILGAYQEIARFVVAGIVNDPDNEQQVNAAGGPDVAEEFIALLDSDELRAAGIPQSAKTAIYGVGLLPVLRMELDDVAAFEAKIAKIETAAGTAMAIGTVEEQSYRYIGKDDARIVLAVFDNYLVVSIVPVALSDAQLSAVLGITLPTQNVAQSGDLEKIAVDYDFTPYALGFFDVTRVVATFLDDQSGVNAELLSLMEFEGTEISDVCAAEIREMSGIMPRVVTGYKEVSVEKFSSNTVLELRSDLAAGFATLAGSVPGLGKDHGGLFSIGMGFDLLAAREFYSARLDALEADPYECESFAELQAGVAQGRAALNQPIPPIAYDFKGFLAIVDTVSGLDFSSPQPPEEIDMRLLVASDNAEGLLAMGSMFSPELAALGLKADGKAVEFKSPQVSSQFDSVFLAMSNSALGVAVGKDSDSRLEELLKAPVSDQPLLMSTHMDAGTYYEIVSEAMLAKNVRTGGDEEKPEMPPELAQAVSGVMSELSELMDRLSIDIALTDRGIEIPTTVTLVQ